MLHRVLFACLSSCCSETEEACDHIEVKTPISIACCNSKIEDQNDSDSGAETDARESLPNPIPCCELFKCSETKVRFAIKETNI